MKRTAIIVAGGSGSRIGGPTPKQFLPLSGKPVLMHTLLQFAASDRIIVVLPEGQIPYWKELVKSYGFTLPHTVVPGGASRYESVRNGLASADPESVIAVHDGVRPIVSEPLINRCYETAALHGTCIPVCSIPDSIRVKEDESSRPADRNRFLLVQTPQCFQGAYIGKAYNGADQPGFTDDASVLEAAGIPLHFTEGERWNIKITFPEDLKVAEALLKHRT
ncbi:MAG: hypothetical protein RL021_391 [Bacteroidota bacterium]|jgi:2-C-methyl-D-erythritol 4-phosphate cytidylyltransferase